MGFGCMGKHGAIHSCHLYCYVVGMVVDGAVRALWGADRWFGMRCDRRPGPGCCGGGGLGPRPAGHPHGSACRSARAVHATQRNLRHARLRPPGMTFGYANDNPGTEEEYLKVCLAGIEGGLAPAETRACSPVFGIAALRASRQRIRGAGRGCASPCRRARTAPCPGPVTRLPRAVTTDPRSLPPRRCSMPPLKRGACWTPATCTVPTPTRSLWVSCFPDAARPGPAAGRAEATAARRAPPERFCE